ncbi:MAG: bifunctional phosphopantothenoylcysteine decarboxylase/phosphopantothenate--cysteine ligase CoaBC [FCB group bacterium]|nr:bifunctional phosphopantothenoylcysteine decarboxylase/phosphopantothenate--cysteine ligase CoaBC [FCB group bacterium]
MTDVSVSLKQKQILICVSGSVAAYKACEVIRLLRKEGAGVQVMMTEAAQKFVGPATFAALSGREVLTELFPVSPKAGLEHIELSLKEDIIVVVPATANIICKAAGGVADDLVSTTLSVCEQPTLFVPAMNSRMWQNPATIEAVTKLRSRGIKVLDPQYGSLASLHEGEGRLPALQDIMNAIRDLFNISQPLRGKKVMVTAGPTREALDPVRYISNRSSGRMGYALAECARDLGAAVTLITGPTTLSDLPEVAMKPVVSAREMSETVAETISAADPDFIFMAAAVSDYTLENPPTGKIKRGAGNLNLSLAPTLDILKSIRGMTAATIVAFALETENGATEARRKMKAKDTDFIVLNYANEDGAGFEVPTNRVVIFSKTGEKLDLPKDRKDRIARKIIHFVLNHKPDSFSPTTEN